MTLVKRSLSVYIVLVPDRQHLIETFSNNLKFKQDISCYAFLVMHFLAFSAVKNNMKLYESIYSFLQFHVVFISRKCETMHN